MSVDRRRCRRRCRRWCRGRAGTLTCVAAVVVAAGAAAITTAGAAGAAGAVGTAGTAGTTGATDPATAANVAPLDPTATTPLPAGGGAPASPAPLPVRHAEGALDSGPIAPGTTWIGLVVEPDAAWLRLRLTADSTLGDGTLVVESIEDGARQRLDADALRDWRHATAYFNGPALVVRVEAGTQPAHLRLASRLVGLPPEPGGPLLDLCDVDDRVPIADPRVARLIAGGGICTGWLIEDCGGCLLSAGHCANATVVQFDVPPSGADGSIQHPPPEDQYAIDPASGQFTDGSAQIPGNDWWTFGCFANPGTGLTPREAQGDGLEIEPMPSDLVGRAIELRGYGLTYDGIPAEWNGTLKSSMGTVAVQADTLVGYALDSTGGDSGGVVLDVETGRALAIHYGGTCGIGGVNLGTLAANDGLQQALADPRGVCRPVPAVRATWPTGRPTVLSPDGRTVSVDLDAGPGRAIDPDVCRVEWRDPAADPGEPPHSLPLVPDPDAKPGRFLASLPGGTCGDRLEWRLVLGTDTGLLATAPADDRCVERWWSAPVALTAGAMVLDGRMPGWSSAAPPGTTGRWAFADIDPSTAAVHGGPGADADGDGWAWVTGIGPGEDVDGGPVVVVSPRFDGRPPEDAEAAVRIRVAVWLDNDDGAAPGEDVVTIEGSSDDGSTWAPVATIGPSGPEATGAQWTWLDLDPLAGAGIPMTATMRLRAVVRDAGDPSRVEAALDGLEIWWASCDDPVEPGSPGG